MVNKIKNFFLSFLQPTASKIEDQLNKWKQEGIHPEVLSINQTIDLLVEKKLSISRFGDGEYSLCFGKSLQFQTFDKKLQDRLKEILKNPTKNPNCLVGIFNFDPSNMSKHWKLYYFKNMHKTIELLNQKHVYANANVSREFTERGPLDLCRLWDKKNIVFVIGKNSRFEIIQELFGNSLSNEIIYSEPINAWFNYSNLLENCLNYAFKENTIFLIALGPTASVLAWDLSLKGMQAIDIGHYTSVYQMSIGKIDSPENIPLKKPE